MPIHVVIPFHGSLGVFLELYWTDFTRQGRFGMGEFAILRSNKACLDLSHFFWVLTVNVLQLWVTKFTYMKYYWSVGGLLLWSSSVMGAMDTDATLSTAILVTS